ncbi:MAG: PilZ domain-containing protein [Nitrospira sp.]|nr:PilZ domain-containing protein [Nitrospira sp.]MDH5624489.1 PilZ domain-containing protein [Nitrospira sp.]
MQTTRHQVAVLNKFRRYPRVRIPAPFSCSLSTLESKNNGWFHSHAEGIGMVYDLSLRGVWVSTEAVLKPGDLVALTLRLPKQIVPAAIKVATVRWTKGQIYGRAFRTLPQSTLSRLSKYMAITTMEKE